MIKLMIGALLITATALAQTPPQTGQTSSPKPASTSAASGNKSNKQTAASAGTSSKSTTTKSASATATAADAARRSPNKKIPAPSMKDNLESKDNALPSYKQAKTGAGKERTQPKYTPRRTASGARPDTMNKRKP
ncbi:hypothetical protein [Spirosoma oryzicola]|uniref:hypothetical protein n=1 Tax=Spirosoma oryzicola TaxID=2898794 RepID=UPI001E5CD9FC|nr:hypothetical protein [Spirosoma oryzicola]UHG90840.1 hypothetical protein LQ777_21675 [Spirosoma oryzicola]